ncbi:MAG: type II toxin-antitoxin system HicA family toxin [Saprospiraceae bacterium]|uniref:Type II toxin-antitoxin system HicA family toxin n=1 Tax=Candidatus Opimibacter skivensis TaxID=2982028 RepID=A0A9D7XP01_9BACT|nr:type II toxin-antitoxin system HicA family toxin [Candidatus Opimibacter skivensis]
MPRKLRDLIKDLKDAGFYDIKGGGKGSLRKFGHIRYNGAVTLSGQPGDDAKIYQEKQLKAAIESITK